MITGLLERLILQGKARYRSYSTGGSALTTIPNNNVGNGLIIVTDFIWNPFNDRDIINEFDPAVFMSKFTHIMRLISNKEDYDHWGFRDVFTRGAPGREITNNGPIQINTFVKSDQDIYVEFFNFSAASSIGWINDTIPLDTQEPASNTGYGNEQANRLLNTPVGVSIINLGVDRDPVGLAAAANPTHSKSEFVDEILTAGIEDNRVLSPVSVPLPISTNYPLVTFGYVEVFDKKYLKDI